MWPDSVWKVDRATRDRKKEKYGVPRRTNINHFHKPYDMKVYVEYLLAGNTTYIDGYKIKHRTGDEIYCVKLKKRVDISINFV